MFSRYETTHFRCVSGIKVDASVEQGAMNIRNHGADVTGGEGGLVKAEAINSTLHVGVPSEIISLINTVNGLWLPRQLQVWPGQNELAERRIQGISLDAMTICDHQFSRTAVATIASADNLFLEI